MDRKERILAAYNYLYANGIVKSKTQLASEMEASRSMVTHAINGRENALTDGFLKRFALTYPCFNVEWLLEDKGEMLKEGVDAKASQMTTRILELEKELYDLRGKYAEVSDKYIALLEKITNSNTDL